MIRLITFCIVIALCEFVCSADNSPLLTVSPSTLLSSPSKVTLTWQNAPSDTRIALFHSISAEWPYGVYEVPSTTGSMQVEAINMRMPFVYKLINSKDNSILATSNQVSFKDVDTPQDIRISLGSNADEMRIMWTSAFITGVPVVRVTPIKSSATYTLFHGSSYTYSINDLCTAPANQSTNFIFPGIYHDVLLTGLKPGTQYQYQVKNNASSLLDWTDGGTFTTAPDPKTTSMINSIVFGDMGVTLPFTTTIPGKDENTSNYPAAGQSLTFLQKAMEQNTQGDPLMILHIGDLSYARGYAFIWEWFMAKIGPIARNVPYMIGIGNHEYDWPGQPFHPNWSDYGTDSGGECGIPYSTRFHMPEPVDTRIEGRESKASRLRGNHLHPTSNNKQSLRNLWYSYNWGPIHYIVMSTEHDFTEGSPQLDWIKYDLSSVDRSITPWIIFTGHRPMYTSSDSFTFGSHIQDPLEPLFQKYGVDVALWGHVHQYERTVPISSHGQKAAPGHGTVHIVIGNAGNNYQVGWIPTSRHVFPIPDWIVFRTMDYGVGTISANHTHLIFANHDDTGYIVHDTFTLYAKDQAWRQNIV